MSILIKHRDAWEAAQNIAQRLFQLHEKSRRTGFCRLTRCPTQIMARLSRLSPPAASRVVRVLWFVHPLSLILSLSWTAHFFPGRARGSPILFPLNLTPSARSNLPSKPWSGIAVPFSYDCMMVSLLLTFVASSLCVSLGVKLDRAVAMACPTTLPTSLGLTGPSS